MRDLVNSLSGDRNMLSKIPSVLYSGLETLPVDVEVNVASRGLPGFEIVGLPSKAVDESKERVRAAISSSGIDFPAKKITVNLAPAIHIKPGAKNLRATTSGACLEKVNKINNGEINIKDNVQINKKNNRIKDIIIILFFRNWCIQSFNNSIYQLIVTFL